MTCANQNACTSSRAPRLEIPLVSRRGILGTRVSFHPQLGRVAVSLAGNPRPITMSAVRLMFPRAPPVQLSVAVSCQLKYRVVLAADVRAVAIVDRDQWR